MIVTTDMIGTIEMIDITTTAMTITIIITAVLPTRINHHFTPDVVKTVMIMMMIVIDVAINTINRSHSMDWDRDLIVSRMTTISHDLNHKVTAFGEWEIATTISPTLRGEVIPRDHNPMARFPDDSFLREIIPSAINPITPQETRRRQLGISRLVRAIQCS